MASELRDTLARLQRKSAVLIEKYQALQALQEQTEQQLQEALEKQEKLEARVQKLEVDNQYLRMAHNIAPTPEALTQSRAMISKIVRDIDRCISQLNT